MVVWIRIHPESSAMTLCECGCGERVRNRFVSGHNARLPRSAEHIANQARVRVGRSIPSLRAENHPFWKGSKASYSAIHKWLNVHHPRQGFCERCGSSASRTEYAFIRHGDDYTRDRQDYLELCTSCHKWFDGYVAEKGWHDSGRQNRTQQRLPA